MPLGAVRSRRRQHSFRDRCRMALREIRRNRWFVRCGHEKPGVACANAGRYVSFPTEFRQDSRCRARDRFSTGCRSAKCALGARLRGPSVHCQIGCRRPAALDRSSPASSSIRFGSRGRKDSRTGCCSILDSAYWEYSCAQNSDRMIITRVGLSPTRAGWFTFGEIPCCLR